MCPDAGRCSCVQQGAAHSTQRRPPAPCRSRTLPQQRVMRCGGGRARTLHRAARARLRDGGVGGSALRVCLRPRCNMREAAHTHAARTRIRITQVAATECGRWLRARHLAVPRPAAVLSLRSSHFRCGLTSLIPLAPAAASLCRSILDAGPLCSSSSTTSSSHPPASPFILVRAPPPTPLHPPLCLVHR